MLTQKVALLFKLFEAVEEFKIDLTNWSWKKYANYSRRHAYGGTRDAWEKFLLRYREASLLPYSVGLKNMTSAHMFYTAEVITKSFANCGAVEALNAAITIAVYSCLSVGWTHPLSLHVHDRHLWSHFTDWQQLETEPVFDQALLLNNQRPRQKPRQDKPEFLKICALVFMLVNKPFTAENFIFLNWL